MPTIATEATFSCVSYASARSAYDSNEGAKQGYFGASRREKRALETPLPCKDKPRSHAMLRDDVRGNTPKRATRFERATFSLEGCSDVSQDAEFAGTYSGVSETPDSRHDSSRGIRRSTATSAT